MPRPNVLLASNFLPPKPCGRGRASAVATATSTSAIESKLLIRSILNVWPSSCHNHGVHRLHMWPFVLTWAAACGSGPTLPKAGPTEPAETHVVVMQPIMPDAAPPDAPELPKLACEAGTEVRPAPAPEPLWFCAKPDGTRSGPFVSLFPDDTIEVSGTYRDGKLEGAWQRHHPGGALAEE